MGDICEAMVIDGLKKICQRIIENSVEICQGVVVTAGGVVTVAATPALLAALGFGSLGIVAGSIAAKMMSYFSVGGQLAAGSLVAILQSLGMGGLSGAATTLAGGTGGTMGWMLSSICNRTTTQ